MACEDGHKVVGNNCIRCGEVFGPSLTERVEALERIINAPPCLSCAGGVRVIEVYEGVRIEACDRCGGTGRDVPKTGGG
jgi:hypothetical protein